MANTNDFENELQDLGIPTGLDIEKLKQDAVEQKNNFSGDDRFLRLPTGKTIVRILPPYKIGRNLYYEEFLQHTIGMESFICKRKPGERIKDCPVCMLSSNYYDSDNPADKAISQKIYARKRYYLNVVLRGFDGVDWEKEKFEEPTDYQNKVFIFSIGIKLQRKIQEFITSEYGDITNVLKGYDLVVVKKMIKLDNGKYIPNYDDSYLRKDSSYLANTPAEIKGILKSAYDLEEIVAEKRKSFTEAKNIIEKYLNENGNFSAVETLNQLLEGKPVINTNARRVVQSTSAQIPTTQTAVSTTEETKPVVNSVETKANETDDLDDFDDFEKEMEEDLNDDDVPF